MRKRSILSAVAVSAGLLLALFFGARSSSALGDGQVYSITYDLRGGAEDISADPNPVSYVSGEKSIVLSDPVKDGSSFSGWSAVRVNDDGTETVLSDISGKAGVTIPIDTTGNLKFTAFWDGETPDAVFTATDESGKMDGEIGAETPAAGTYSITYNLSGGTADNPASYDTGSTIPLVNPTREGFLFNGWVGLYTDTGKAVDFISDMKDVTIPSWASGNLSFTAVYVKDPSADAVQDVLTSEDENGLKSKGAFAYAGDELGKDIYIDSDDMRTLQEHIDTLSAIVDQNKENSNKQIQSLDGIKYSYTPIEENGKKAGGMLEFVPSANHAAPSGN